MVAEAGLEKRKFLALIIHFMNELEPN